MLPLHQAVHCGCDWMIREEGAIRNVGVRLSAWPQNTISQLCIEEQALTAENTIQGIALLVSGWFPYVFPAEIRLVNSLCRNNVQKSRVKKSLGTFGATAAF